MLFVLFCASVVFLAVTARGQSAPHPLATLILTVTAPIQDGVVRIYKGASGLWGRYVGLTGVARENEQLRQEVFRLTLLLSRTRELERENARLAREVGFSRRAPYKVLAARVVAGDPSRCFKCLVLDKGSADGVAPGMAVVTPLGLAGRITHAAPGYSRVILISDPGSALDVRLARSRARGIVQGEGDGPCRMKYALKTSDIKDGDQVVTSGMDRVFPPGLLVGTVTGISLDAEGMFADVMVSPGVDFSLLEEVLVVLSDEQAPEWEAP